MAASSTSQLPLSLSLTRVMGMGSQFACGSESSESSGAVAPDYRVNSLAFSDDGKLLYACSNDGVVAVADAAAGTRLGEYHVKDVGCRLVQATHADMHVLHAAGIPAPSPAAGQIMYHDLHANTALRHFRHSARVTSLAMNPRSETFLSVSLDSTFRTWDLRSPVATGQGSLNLDMLKLPVGPLGDLPHPVGGFCDKGDVFAIALPSRMLSLYNFKELAIDENAPFSGQPFDSLSVPAAQWLTAPTLIPREMTPDFQLPPPYPVYTSFTSLRFSPDGRFIALSTADRGVIVLDAMKPSREYAVLNAHPVEPAHPCGCAWSADSRVLAVGGADGHVWAYDVTLSPTGLPAFVGQQPGAFPWRPTVRAPAAALVGEAYKTPAAAAAAHAAAAKHLADLHGAMAEARARAGAGRAPGGLPLGPPRSCPNLPPPLAAGPEEMASRHESPVTALAWHPTAPVIASAARTVALWAPPTDAAWVPPAAGAGAGAGALGP